MCRPSSRILVLSAIAGLGSASCVRLGVGSIADDAVDASLTTDAEASDAVAIDAVASDAAATDAAVDDTGVGDAWADDAATGDAGTSASLSLEIDPSFGGASGYVSWQGTSPGDNFVSDVAFDANGRMLVLGMTFNTGSLRDLALWRLATDGVPDPTFADGGYLKYSASPYDWGSRIFPLASGRILVVGNIDYGTDDPTIWRFTEDGGLDVSFGQSGRARIVLPGEVQGHSGALDLAGRVYLLGRQFGNWFDVSRFSSDGARDTTFAQGSGHFTFNALPSSSGVEIKLDNAGRPVVVGGVRPRGATTDSDLGVWRFTEDGLLDVDFGEDGIFIHDGAAREGSGGNGGGGNDGGSDVIFMADDSMIVVGHSANTSTVSQMTLWKLQPNGTLDASFGNQGVVTQSSPVGHAGGTTGTRILRQDETHFLVVGSAIEGDDSKRIAIWRMTIDGDLDPSFENGGWFKRESMAYEEALSATWDGANRLVIGGRRAEPTTTEAAVWRFEFRPR
ncbi:MAG: hypothetical protein IPK13_02775 [Deltaproteobacteria bacterium]|nr:hypothetical protein [Deltaproteobacteria bacterium]